MQEKKDRQSKRERTPKERSRPRSFNSNRNSSAYQEIKAVVDRILDHKHKRRELPADRISIPSHTQMVKPCIHQPIMNNFIVVNHNCGPVAEKPARQ